MYSTVFKSPIGFIEIRATEAAVCSVKFIEENGANETLSPTHTPLLQCLEELTEYFEGNRRDFTFPMEQTGTEFQQRVWTLLTEIPFGKTISYRQLAKQLGDVKAIRAVGTSNGKNNLAIVVPCHRVIGSNHKLTGYAGGLWRKQWLLEHEAKYSHGVQQLVLI